MATREAITYVADMAQQVADTTCTCRLRALSALRRRVPTTAYGIIR